MFAEQRNERVRSASVALTYGGKPAFDQVVAAWPKEQRERLRITQGTRRPDGADPAAAAQHAQLPAVLAPRHPVRREPAAQRPAGRQPGAAGQPVARRPAQAGHGRPRVRLTAGMGRRRDEIADLAQDFDAMAERLQQLIASRDRLLHDVSHELRSPIARMSVAVGLARKSGDMSRTGPGAGSRWRARG
ncbi:MAG: hypothetical protein WDN45_05525 [Caulobacteraceae bacterium]